MKPPSTFFYRCLIASGIFFAGVLLCVMTDTRGEEDALPESRTMFYRLLFAPDGVAIAAATDIGLGVWNSKSGLLLWDGGPSSVWINTISISPDNRLLACAGAGSEVEVRGLYTGKLVAKLTSKYFLSVSVIAFSAHGKELAVGSSDGRVEFFSTTDWSRKEAWHSQSKSRVSGIRYCPDDKQLLIGVNNEIVLLRRDDLTSPAPVFATPRGIIKELTLSNDGKTAFVAGACGGIYQYDLASKKQVFAYQGHRKSAYGVTQLGTGEIASVGADGFLRIWAVGQGQPVFQTEIHPFLGTVASSPDGTTFATGGPVIRLWEPGNKVEIRQLPLWKRGGPEK